MQLVAPFVERPQIEVKPHQWETFAFYLSNHRGYNLSSCGSGKTLPTVLAIKELYNAGLETKVLVNCPVQVVEATWMDHFAQFAPEVPLLDLSYSRKRKPKAMEQLKTFRGVVFVNPDGLPYCVHEMVNWRPKLFVIDELSASYRNWKSNRWKAASALKGLVRPSIWAFTGTPMANKLMDIYSQCLLVNPDMLPRNRSGRVVKYKELRDMLMYQPYPDVWLPKKNALEMAFKIMQPAIRFRREDVMSEIKTPITVRKQIPLSAEQKKLLKALQDQGKAQFGTGTLRAADSRVLSMKATQICVGTVFDTAKNVQVVDSSPRLDALVALFDEVEMTPIIVAVVYVPAILKLAEQLRLQKYRVGIIHGDVPPSERAEIIRDFQAGKYDFLVAHPRTLAHGVTLTRSSTVCWYGPYNDMEFVSQLNDRIFRFGQTGQPLIVEFSSTPIEAKIYASNLNKEKLSVSYLDLF